MVQQARWAAHGPAPACIGDWSDHGLRDFVEATKDRICFLHLYDARGDISHLTPGTDEIPEEDWAYLLDALRQIDFQGAGGPEVRPPPERPGQTPIEAAIEALVFLERLG